MVTNGNLAGARRRCRRPPARGRPNVGGPVAGDCPGAKSSQSGGPKSVGKNPGRSPGTRARDAPEIAGGRCSPRSMKPSPSFELVAPRAPPVASDTRIWPPRAAAMRRAARFDGWTVVIVCHEAPAVNPCVRRSAPGAARVVFPTTPGEIRAACAVPRRRRALREHCGNTACTPSPVVFTIWPVVLNDPRLRSSSSCRASGSPHRVGEFLPQARRTFEIGEHETSQCRELPSCTIRRVRPSCRFMWASSASRNGHRGARPIRHLVHLGQGSPRNSRAARSPRRFTGVARSRRSPSADHL